MCMCTYCATRSKNALGISRYHLKWLHWHNIFTVERCRASALPNAHVSLSFFWNDRLKCYCCDQKRPSGMCAKLRTVAASNNRYHCLFAPHICGVVLRAHPVRGESHIQRNANGVVAALQVSSYVGQNSWTTKKDSKRN